MVLTARPFNQGRLVVISGPVHSEKAEEVEGFLDKLGDSGFRRDSNVVVFRHPADDSDPERIGQHKAKVTEDVAEIYEAIGPHTGTVVIVGASHYRDSSLVLLVDAIVRSNRQMVVSGLNLDVEGKPFGLMPSFMGLADEVILSKAICDMYPACGSAEANRSVREGEEYAARCTSHYSSPDAPEEAGKLELFLGPMFSAKTTRWSRALKKVERVNVPHVVFMWRGHTRYGEKEGELFGLGNVTLHNKTRIPAVLVDSAKDIQNYLGDHPDIKAVFFDEGQFLGGLYRCVFDLLPQGYNFYGTALPRGFSRQGFGEVPSLMCSADRINMETAVCVTPSCGRPGTDNQRMKRVGGRAVPAHASDPLVLVGGKDERGAEYYYEPRCLDHWELRGEKPLEYRLSRFSW